MIWSGERTLNLATRRTDSGSVGLPGPNADFRHIAANLFRRRDDVFSVRAKDPDLRLSEVHRAVPQSDSGEREKAAEAGLQIEFIRKRSVRKEDRVKELLEKRASTPVWCASSRLWKPVRPTSRGTANRQVRRTWFPTTANACTITSASWMKNPACVTCGCRHGCPAACRSADLPEWPFTGWRGSYVSSASIIKWPTTPSHTFADLANGAAHLQRLGSETNP